MPQTGPKNARKGRPAVPENGRPGLRRPRNFGCRRSLKGHGRSFSGDAPCSAPGPSIRTPAGARRPAISPGRQQAFVPRRDGERDGARGLDQAGGRPLRDHARGRIGLGSDSPSPLSAQRALFRRRPQRAVHPLPGGGIVQRIDVAIGADVALPASSGFVADKLHRPPTVRAGLPDWMQQRHLASPASVRVVPSARRAQVIS